MVPKDKHDRLCIPNKNYRRPDWLSHSQRKAVKPMTAAPKLLWIQEVIRDVKSVSTAGPQ